MDNFAWQRFWFFTCAAVAGAGAGRLFGWAGVALVVGALLAVWSIRGDDA